MTTNKQPMIDGKTYFYFENRFKYSNFLNLINENLNIF